MTSLGRDDDALFAQVVGGILKEGMEPSGPWTEERGGVALRPIWDDRSFLMRCRAGTQIPSHLHEFEERLVILDGEIRIGDQHHSTGACIVSPQGSLHEPAEAIGDCLILVQYGAGSDR